MGYYWKARTKKFLLFDNENNTNRTIVLRLPKECESCQNWSSSVWLEHFLLVGTKEFYQIYILHACIKNRLISRVHALLQRKTKEIFVNFYQNLNVYSLS